MLKSFKALTPALRLFYAEKATAHRFPLEDDELAAIETMIRALDIVEEAVKRLSPADATTIDAEMAIETMLEKLDDFQDVFSISLRRNLGIRILQRRGVLSRLARYIEERSKTSALNLRLDTLRESVRSEGRSDILKTFFDKGNFAEEIDSFHNTEQCCSDPAEPQPQKGQENRPKDRYEIFKERQRAKQDGRSEIVDLGAKLRMKIHESGGRSLPKALCAIAGTLHPTSVPSERLFSRARYSRRFCQERQNDARFANYMFLKDCYQKAKPWGVFLAEHDLSADCDVKF